MKLSRPGWKIDVVALYFVGFIVVLAVMLLIGLALTSGSGPRRLPAQLRRCRS